MVVGMTLGSSNNYIQHDHEKPGVLVRVPAISIHIPYVYSYVCGCKWSSDLPIY